MGFLDRLKTTLFSREDARQRAEEEARFHLEMRAEELQRRGLDPRGAAARARVAYGNLARQQEAASDADLFTGLEGMMRDVKVAYRRLGRSPVFFVSSVVLLTLGLGVNAAVFSVMDLLFLRSLPFANADRLVVLEEIRIGGVGNSNPLRLADWAARVKGFEAVASQYGETTVLHQRDGNRAVATLRVAGDWVGLLGMKPLEGRLIRPEELRGGKVALLTEHGRGLGKPGDTLRIGSDAFEVVGVVGNEVALGEDVDVLTPMSEGLLKGSRKAGFIPVVARLRPGVTAQTAEAEAASVAEQLAREYPESDKGMTVRVKGAQEAWMEGARRPALYIQAAAGLLLLITMVNLAGLLAARAMERQREDTVRLFLGAGRWHLIRLHLVEAGLVVGAGCGAAMLAAPWMLALLQAHYGSDFTAINSARVDLRVFLYLLTIGAVSTLLLAAAMGWQASREPGARGIVQFQLRNVLVVAEASMGLVLLAVSLQMMSDFSSLRFAPNGFKEQGLLNARVDLPWGDGGYELEDVIRRGLEEVAAIPGVTGVAVVDRLPLEGNSQDGQMFVDGQAEKTRETVGQRMATNGYFALMGIPLLAGELPRDKNSVLVNEKFARTYLNNDAVGHSVSRDAKTVWRISGVVGNVRTNAKDQGARAEVFGNESNVFWPKLNVVIRTSQAPASIAPAIRTTWTGISSLSSFAGVGTLEGRLDEIVAKPRRQRDIVSVFGLAALALVVAGVYGVMAGEMSRRRKEMGIRAAIGASQGNLIAIGLKRAATLSAVACAVGAILTLLLLNRWVNAQTLIEGCVAISVGMLGAALVPAWRMARVDPMLALRQD